MDEQPLKPGWTQVKFGDVVRLNTDRCADPIGEGIERYVGLEHIEPEDLRIRRWGLVVEGTTFTNRFQPGQVLFGKRRAYQRKVAVADFAGVCSGDIYVFEPKDERLLPELLPFLCQTERFFEYAVGTSAGSLSPRTNWTQLANYEFALPSLEEQRKLSNAFWDIENLIGYLDNAERSGKILLNSLREHHFNFVRERYPNCEQPVEKLATNVTKGESPGWQGHKYQAHGIKFITSENVLSGYLSFEPEKFIPSEFSDKLMRSKLLTGDILINIVGGSIGRICIVPPDIGDANINQAVAMVRLRDEKILPDYFLSCLLTPTYNHKLCNKSVDDYKPNLSLTSIRTFEIPVPSIEVQQDHIQHVQQIQNAILSLNCYRQSTLAIKHSLLSGVNDISSSNGGNS